MQKVKKHSFFLTSQPLLRHKPAERCKIFLQKCFSLFSAWPFYKIQMRTFIHDTARSEKCSVSLEEVTRKWVCVQNCASGIQQPMKLTKHIHKNTQYNCCCHPLSAGEHFPSGSHCPWHLCVIPKVTQLLLGTLFTSFKKNTVTPQYVTLDNKFTFFVCENNLSCQINMVLLIFTVNTDWIWVTFHHCPLVPVHRKALLSVFPYSPACSEVNNSPARHVQLPQVHRYIDIEYGQSSADCRTDERLYLSITFFFFLF